MANDHRLRKVEKRQQAPKQRQKDWRKDYEKQQTIQMKAKRLKRA